MSLLLATSLRGESSSQRRGCPLKTVEELSVEQVCPGDAIGNPPSIDVADEPKPFTLGHVKIVTDAVELDGPIKFHRTLAASALLRRRATAEAGDAHNSGTARKLTALTPSAHA